MRRGEEIAALFSRGISIDGIGEMVLNGIRRNKAYIFTHASTQHRMRHLVTPLREVALNREAAIHCPYR